MNADDRHSPVRARVLDEAIAWQLLLDSGEAHPDDHRAFHRWYAAHPEHERAWEQLGGLDRHLARAANGPARNALLSGNARFKRRLRRLGGSALGLVLALGVGLGVANRYVPVRYLLADAYSATGEQRELTLPDATHVRLNSRSAIDVRFDGERRQVVLLAGEILVETAHGDPRPFVVSSADGDMRALGTRFLVRREEPGTRLTVLQSAVAARGNAQRRACDQGRPAGADPAARPAGQRSGPGHGRRLGTRHAGGGERPAGRPGGGTGALFAGAAAGRPEHRRPARHRQFPAEGHPPRPSGFGAEPAGAQREAQRLVVRSGATLNRTGRRKFSRRPYHFSDSSGKEALRLVSIQEPRTCPARRSVPACSP